jgi:SagB-type dehydrogenase family enzyme
MTRAPRSLLLAAVLFVPVLARAESKILTLPPPSKEGRISVESALVSRRTVRSYADRALTLAEVGQLLWAAQGVTGSDGKRTAPSARSRYPLEIAVVAQNVAGLAKGAYRYLPAKHALELLAASDRPMLAVAAKQAHVQSAGAVFVIAAVYERMGSTPRDRTWTDYEAGLASENLLLQTVALGLSAGVVGGMDPDAVKEALKLAGSEQVIVVIPVGPSRG